MQPPVLCSAASPELLAPPPGRPPHQRRSLPSRRLYFVDDTNFEAGYSNSSGATCIGIIVDAWSTTKVVLQFGNAYGTFAHWYLSNGDGYAISVKNGIFGGTVSGLS